MKRLLYTGIILLFVGMSISSSNGFSFEKDSTFPLLDGKTLYVGGSGPGNYTKIQDAIDNASDGDTVFVYNGIYSHFFPINHQSCVFITKSINLIGEDKNNTIINGSGKNHVIAISNVKNTTISGFTLQNGGTPGTTLQGWGIVILQSDNIQIYDNIVQWNKIGFRIDDGGENISIFDNIIQKNDNGISIKNNPEFVKVFCNFITNNKLGIDLIRTFSCSVYKNIISYNDVGISLWDFSLLIIEYNQLEGNNVGVSAEHGNGIIQYNNFINNTKHAYFKKYINLFRLGQINSYKQNWNSNYWDDWMMNKSRVIKGHISLYFNIWIFWFPNARWNKMPFYIGNLPSYQFDKHPVQEPYDIGG